MSASPPERLVDRAALFADLGYAPHAGQLQVHLSPARRRVVACGVRWGKTLCAAMEGLAAALEPRERTIGWVVAPTYDLAERVFKEIVIVAAEHMRHRIVTLREREHRLVLRNLGGGVSEIRGKSADNPVSLLGEGLDWLVVDEAARLKPAIWESHLCQRLVDRRGWALLISTPRGKGWLYELFRRGQQGVEDHASWNYPSWSSPLLDGEQLDKERERLPERVFRQEYGGEFLEGSGAVFRNVRENATGSWSEPEPQTRYYAGLDLARVEDFTVMVIADKDCRVVKVDRFTKLDWALQIGRVKALSERYGRPSMLVDSTGAGEPVFESLRAAGCRVEPYAFTQASKNALITSLAQTLETHQLVLPRPELWPVGIEELEAFEYSITERGSVRTSAPGGEHDDCVIALALALWQQRPTRQRNVWTYDVA